MLNSQSFFLGVSGGYNRDPLRDLSSSEILHLLGATRVLTSCLERVLDVKLGFETVMKRVTKRPIHRILIETVVGLFSMMHLELMGKMCLLFTHTNYVIYPC